MMPRMTGCSPVTLEQWLRMSSKILRLFQRTKKSFSLPLDDASDDWMLEEDMGAMVEEDEESRKDETGKEESKKPADHLVSHKKLSVDKPTVESKKDKEPIDNKQAIEKGEGQSQKKS